MHFAALLCLFSTALLLSSDGVAGHGMILDPPGRSSMWRFGYDVPTNTNDNGLNCGGVDLLYDDVNQGRCGECGDMWSLPRPRQNDEGGRYGTGIIGKYLTQGQLVNTTIELTASHLGYFEFRLCAKSSAEELVTQECLDRRLLELEDGSTRYQVTSWSAIVHHPVIRLPTDVTCDHCVLQWYYKGGNSAGPCEPTESGYPCGRQETFANCADIAITRASG